MAGQEQKISKPRNTITRRYTCTSLYLLIACVTALCLIVLIRDVFQNKLNLDLIVPVRATDFEQDMHNKDLYYPLALNSDIVMTHFEQHKRADDMWYSPPIYTHYRGYQFSLGVIANGDLDGQGTHVTVAVFFMKGMFDDFLKWPFRGEIQFQLIDQLSGAHHLEHNISYDNSVPDKHCTRVTEGERAKWGWGPDKFIPHTELKPRYLQSDSLVFRIKKILEYDNKPSRVRVRVAVGQKEQSLDWKEHGLKMYFPKHSVGSQKSCYINISSSLSGNYTLPENHKLVSAVYWIELSPECQFSKPVTVEIQHCASKEDIPKLAFVKAHVDKSPHTPKLTFSKEESSPFEFQVQNEGATFSEISFYGTLKTTKFCKLAIVCNETNGDQAKRFYSAKLFYMGKALQSWTIYLTITWDLDIHNQYVDEDYEQMKVKRNKEFKYFLKGSSLAIQLTRDWIKLNMTLDGIQVNGWKILPLIDPIITQELVDKFGPGKNIPRYELTAKGVTTPLTSLFHRLSLVGAKKPNILTIDIDPSIIFDTSIEVRKAFLDRRPTMKELRSFTTKEGKTIDLVELIGINYAKFGTLILPHKRIKAIEQSRQLQVEQIVNDILADWLDGKGESPVTWATLITVLEKSGLTVLASDIRSQNRDEL